MDDDYRPRQPRLPRNQTRRQRNADRRNTAQPHPGGITTSCGCIYTRTGNTWQHITPCPAHQLSPFPLSDETMKAIT